MKLEQYNIRNREQLKELTNKVLETYYLLFPRTFSQNEGDVSVNFYMEELIGSEKVLNEDRTFYVERFDFQQEKKWKFDPNEEENIADVGSSYYHNDDEFEQFDFLAQYTIYNTAVEMAPEEENLFSVEVYTFWDKDLIELQKNIQALTGVDVVWMLFPEPDKIKFTLETEQDPFVIFFDKTPGEISFETNVFEKEINQNIHSLIRKQQKKMSMKQKFKVGNK